MRVSYETSLSEFNFWSGAKDLAAKLTTEEFEAVERFLEEESEDWSETAINDLFRFDGDYIAQILGYDSEEEILEREE